MSFRPPDLHLMNTIVPVQIFEHYLSTSRSIVPAVVVNSYELNDRRGSIRTNWYLYVVDSRFRISARLSIRELL